VSNNDDKKGKTPNNYQLLRDKLENSEREWQRERIQAYMDNEKN
jgi:negative regulator of sigma E activity